MTDPRSLLDAHASAFRQALEAGAARAARTRRRRRTAALGLPLVAAVSLTVALWPGEQASVLQRAAAALTPATDVVHFRVASQTNGTVRGACDRRAPDDVWVETSGTSPRWRWRQPQMHRRCGVVSTGFGHRLVGPTENAYDGRALITSSAAGGWVERFTDPSAAARAVPDVARLGGITRGTRPEDPVRFVQRLLHERRLQVGGRGTVRGRDVYWLTGKDVQRATVRVAIDESDYAPVTVIREIPVSDFVRKNPEVGAALGSKERIDFEVYEPATRADLQPEPLHDATRIDMNWADAMTAMRARRTAQSRAGHLSALRTQRERAARTP